MPARGFYGTNAKRGARVSGAKPVGAHNLSVKERHREILAETDAVVAAALARLDAAPPGARAAESRTVIEHRTGTRTECRVYASSPLREPVMGQGAALPDPRMEPGFCRPQFIEAKLNGGKSA